jgi:GNAT superfamily N-acetyltransferase
MADDRAAAVLSVGDRDPDLAEVLDMWVHRDHRKDGWGAKILAAAEDEARRRGCDRACVSSFTFQALGFYQKYGYVETGRTLGIPGGGEDVHMFKRL